MIEIDWNQFFALVITNENGLWNKMGIHPYVRKMRVISGTEWSQVHVVIEYEKSIFSHFQDHS